MAFFLDSVHRTWSPRADKEHFTHILNYTLDSARGQHFLQDIFAKKTAFCEFVSAGQLCVRA